MPVPLVVLKPETYRKTLSNPPETCGTTKLYELVPTVAVAGVGTAEIAPVIEFMYITSELPANPCGKVAVIVTLSPTCPDTAEVMAKVGAEAAGKTMIGVAVVIALEIPRPGGESETNR